ncbi:MAG: hypothetical protein CRN43_15545 [Candidatus Nephrothrix sp. EaCA]|nr:MAG: hypothetical protein CRN43_15545 [Candidatus Nephrothrix sp. EaCA]
MIRPLISSMALVSLITCFSCIFYRQPPQEKLFFLTEVRNIKSVNSIYDDMNSVDWGARAEGVLYFSSNRNSKGGDFDIVPASFNYYTRGKRREEDWGTGSPFDYEQKAIEKEVLPRINTEYSEIGPCVFWSDWLPPRIRANLSRTREGDPRTRVEEALALAKKQGWHQGHYWFYANNSAGNFDIKFISCDEHLRIDAKKKWRKGTADLINSSADDCYPTFDTDNGYIYFCSNRSGRFQLYRAAADYNQDLAITLQNKGEVELVRELSGDGNDKCPYILGDVMAFTSDRSGGQGGFDLYFSKYGNGSWSPPVNMGDKINSPKDEYRPIINGLSANSKNDLLIFSSNREGGKGGFDLYHVGTNIFRK